MNNEEAEAQYFSKDFEWKTLKQQVENHALYQYHLLPFNSSSQQQELTGAANAWQRFHIRHSSGKFFKERRYLLKEFPDLIFCPDFSKVLEVGCGSGSSLIPILRGNKSMIVYACDCSTETLDTARQNVDAAEIASINDRFKPFYCDFALTKFPKWLICDSCRSQKQHECSSPDVKEISTMDADCSDISKEGSCCVGGVDFVTLIFTLSAVPLKKMPMAILECFNVLKPGGLLLFRDYGLYDMTMLRFEPEKRVGFREYMRSDGTRSYFFCLDTVRDLFRCAGYIELELEYCCVTSVNHKKGKSMQRVWVHGKFQKPQ